MHFKRSKVNASAFVTSFAVGIAVMGINTADVHAMGRERLKEGNYNGPATFNSVYGLDNRTEDEIRAEVKKVDGGFFITLKNFDGQELKGTKGTPLKPIEAMRWRHWGILKPVTFDLTIPYLQDKPFKMKQNLKNSKGCFTTDSEFEVDFCLDDESFTLDVKEQGVRKISFDGTKFSVQSKLENENARIFTVSQAIDAALKKNFDIKLEKENMFQTKIAAKKAKLLLLPHISFNSLTTGALGLAAFDPADPIGTASTVLGVAKEIMPFLFPSNYINIAIQKWQAKAEQMVYTLLQANTAVSVEQLAVTYVNKKALRTELHTISDEAKQMLDVVKNLESTGQMSAGSTNQIQVSLDKVNEALTEADHELDDTNDALALIMGFNNPDVIKDMVLDENITSVESIPLLTSDQKHEQQEEYTNCAIQNSLEVKQQEFLENAVKDSEANVFLNWLTPDADMPLGFQLIAEEDQVKSELRVIKHSKGKIRQGLKSHAYDMIEERNDWVRFYPTELSSVNLRRQMWDEFKSPFLAIKKAMEKGTQIENPDLSVGMARSLLDDLVAGLKSYHSLRSVISGNQAELDRLALRGPFKKLLPHVQNGNTQPSGTTTMGQKILP